MYVFRRPPDYLSRRKLTVLLQSAFEGVYSRGEYAALPSDDANLTTTYTASDRDDVASDNGVRVAQTAQDAYFAIHEYKDYVGSSQYVNITCNLQSDLAPSVSTVYLAAYNYILTTWVVLASESTESADTDFNLQSIDFDCTNYKSSGWMCCRVYQENA